MSKKKALTMVLAVTGTVIAWLPVLFTILTAIIGSVRSNRFRCDYLMPAELFPVATTGGLILFWAAMRVRKLHKPIGLLILAMIIFLVGGQAIAVVTGLADGSVEFGGWQMALTIGGIALYTIALISIGCLGILLVKKLIECGGD